MFIEDNYRPALPGLVDEHLQGVVRRTCQAEPEAARQEVGLEVGSSTVVNAACTMRSRTAGIDNGGIDIGGDRQRALLRRFRAWR